MKTQKLKLITTIFLSSAIVLNTCAIPGVAFAEAQNQTEHEMVFEAQNSITESGKYELDFTIAPDIDTTTSELVDIIVEFKGTPIGVANAAKGKSAFSRISTSSLEEEHENFKSQLNQRVQGKNNGDSLEEQITFNEEYFYAFNGIAMTIPGDQVEGLLKLPQVSKVWKNSEVRLPEVINEEPVNTRMIMESFPEIGVDRLHDEGVLGEGIKVGVLDTGIDYNHPDLKDVYKGGYDFVNKDENPMETTYNDWKNTTRPEFSNGNSYYTYHGTHVAGTIAAQAKNTSDLKAMGVAPGVELYAYKVLGPYGSGANSGILAGIDRAVQDGMDVINLSLGSLNNNSLHPTSVAINNAALAGVVPVVAAGNAGPKEFTLGSPGTSPLAITVGASNTTLTIPTFNGQANDTTVNFKLFANNYNYKLNELKGKEFEMVSCGLGKTSDFEGKDLTGKIALIQRGEIPFVEKIANAKKAGAELVFMYNNIEGYIPSYLDTSFDYIPAFNLEKQAGEALVSSLDESNLFTFNDISSEILQGDLMADFSSRGPVTNTSEIKPDVVAPGVNILSTYPEFIQHPQEGEDYSTAYNKISGTSMATPHVAGIVALMLGEAKENGEELSVSEVKTLLMNNAENLNEEYSVYEKGAGRVNAYDAVMGTMEFKIVNETQSIKDGEVINVDSVSGALQFGFNYDDGKDSIKEKTIIVTNNSEEEKTFNLTVTTTTAEGLIKDSVKNNVKLNVAEEIKVPAGETLEIPVTLNIPTGAEYGFYEGNLKITNTVDSKEDYLIPYAMKFSGRGIGSFTLSRNVVSNDRDFYHQFFFPILGYTISFNSPMKSQKVYLKDAETGERIGILDEIDNMDIIPDVQYKMYPAFTGKYIPLIGDYKENRVAYVEEGHYKFEIETLDAEGNVYTAEEDLIIDNAIPEIILEEGTEFGIHEISEEDFTVEDGIEAYYFEGKIYDESIDKLKALGYTHTEAGQLLSQKLNTLQYYQNLPNERSPYYTGTIKLDEEGNFKIGVTREEIAENPLELSLFPYDFGTAGDHDYMNYFGFIDASAPYADITYDLDKVQLGDTQIGHMNFKSMKDVTKIEFNIGFADNIFDLEYININPKFEDYVKSCGAQVKLSHEPTSDKSITNKGGEAHKVVVEIEGGKGLDINEKIPVLDIATKVVDDNSHITTRMFYFTIKNSNNTYTTSQGTVNQLNIMSFINAFKFIPRKSISGTNFVSAEGFFNEKGYAKRLDYSKMDAKVYVITPEGERFDGVIDDKGLAEVIAPTGIEEGDLYIEVPGHFGNKFKTRLGKIADGDLIGTYSVSKILTAYAGDMNGDDIIDDKDKEVLAADLGKTTTAAENYIASDINKDRVVDEKDMEYIDNNLGMVNPRMVEEAEVAVYTMKKSNDLSDLQNALDKVNLLPESDKKQQLLDEIKAITEPIYIGEATKAVEKAEVSKAQADVDTAKALVDALSASEAKNELLARLNVVQEEINYQIAVDTATKAVEKAEESKTQADVDAAKALVEALTDSEIKTDLIERLNVVQDSINYEIAVENAIKAVEKAEQFVTQADIDAAKALVDGLKESDLKNELLERLNVVQEVINNATALENATKAVEKAETTKTQTDVDGAMSMVEALVDSEAKTELIERLNVVQEAINNATALENATKAVEKAETTKTQADLDSAKALVEALVPSKEKEALHERLEKVQKAINAENHIKEAIEEATKAVEKAEKTKDKKDIKVAEKLVKKLPDGKVKDELLARLKKLSASLPQTGGATGSMAMMAMGTAIAGAGLLTLKKRRNK